MAAPAAKQSPSPSADPRNLLEDLVQRARKAGADAADAVLFDSASSVAEPAAGQAGEARARGEPRSRPARLRRQAPGHRLDDRHLRHHAERAGRARRRHGARACPRIPSAASPIPPIWRATIRRRSTSATPASRRPPCCASARASAEEAARAVKGVTNSEGADAGWSRGAVIALAATQRLRRQLCELASRRSASPCSPAKARPWSATTIMSPPSMAPISRTAPSSASAPASARCAGSTRARRRRRKVPVVYDPRVSGGLVGHLAGAINGAAIARGTSFLKDKLGQRIFGAGITIIDDPHRPRGLRSKPFDGEGLANQRRAIDRRRRAHRPGCWICARRASSA